MTKAGAEENVMQFRILESRLEGMIKHRDMVVNRLNEIEATISSIDQASKAKGEVLFHVGGEAFMHAKPSEEGKVLVMIGAEVAMEKTADEAKKLLASRKAEAENVMKQVQKEIESLTSELEAMAAHIEGGHGH